MAQRKDIADKGYTAVNEAANLNDVILSVQKKGTMPTAACYRVLKEHPELIVQLNCNVCGMTTNGTEVGDCMKNHMHGRDKLTLAEDRTYAAVYIQKD